MVSSALSRISLVSTNINVAGKRISVVAAAMVSEGTIRRFEEFMPLMVQTREVKECRIIDSIRVQM